MDSNPTPASTDPNQADGAAGDLRLSDQASNSKTTATTAAVASAPGRDMSTPAISTGNTSRAPWFSPAADSLPSSMMNAKRSAPIVRTIQARGLSRVTVPARPRPHSQPARAQASSAYKPLTSSAAVLGE
jgi:hypothetical protein